MQRNWKRADGEQETEPALEQWCKVTVLKRTLTGENLHAFRQMDAQKKHTQLHPDKNLRYLRGCSCVTDTYMYCKSKQTVLPNSISTCFLIPLLAALVCVWLKLLLPVYLPSEKLNQNQQKCLLAGRPSLSTASLFPPLWFSELRWKKAALFSVNDTSWLWSKLPQLNNGTYVLQLKKATRSADRAALYEAEEERKGEAGLKSAGEGKRGWECDGESLESKCVFFSAWVCEERERERKSEWERGGRERAGRGLAINNMNIPPPFFYFFFPAPFSIQGSHLHAPLRTLKCNFLPGITWQQ